MTDILNILQALLGAGFVCASLAKTGIFKFAKIEVGFHQYAELVDPSTFLKMPFNAAVNLGYVLVGIFWLVKIRKANVNLSAQAVYYHDVFSIMSILYGPVQFLRIITQYPIYGVLDQWFTLPIFAWAAIWGIFVVQLQKSFTLEYPMLFISITSYFLTLVTDIGFEVALSMHIFSAVLMGVTCQKRFGTSQSMKCIIMAILCCSGFVVLKWGLWFVNHIC